MTCRYCLQKINANLPEAAATGGVLPAGLKPELNSEKNLWQGVITQKRRAYKESMREYFRWMALEGRRAEVLKLLENQAFLEQIQNQEAFGEAALIFGQATLDKAEELLFHPAAVVRKVALAALQRGLPPEKFLELLIAKYPQVNFKIGLSHWRGLMLRTLKNISDDATTAQPNLYQQVKRLLKDTLPPEKFTEEITRWVSTEVLKKMLTTKEEWDALFQHNLANNLPAALDCLRDCPSTEVSRYAEQILDFRFSADKEYDQKFKATVKTVLWNRLPTLPVLADEEIVTALELGWFGNDYSFLSKLSPEQTKSVLEKLFQQALRSKRIGNFLTYLETKDIQWQLSPADAEELMNSLYANIIKSQEDYLLADYGKFAVHYWQRQNNQPQVEKYFHQTVQNCLKRHIYAVPDLLNITPNLQKIVTKEYQAWQKSLEEQGTTALPIEYSIFWSLGKNTDNLPLLEQILQENQTLFSSGYEIPASGGDTENYKDFYLKKLIQNSDLPKKERTAWQKNFLSRYSYADLTNIFSPAWCQEIKNFLLTEAKPEVFSNSAARRILLKLGKDNKIIKIAQNIILNYEREGTGLQDLATNYIINLKCHLEQPLPDDEAAESVGSGGNH